MTNVVVLGAHPDDSESGCGGLITNLVDQGIKVKILCMTRGEKAPSTNTPEENARIRTEEAIRGAQILGADVDFLGFVDGELVADQGTFSLAHKKIIGQNPDIVVAHWPVDSHTDHQACGLLALRSLLSDSSFVLYFYEVFTGRQSMNFVPTHYVDIGDSREKKHRACLAHESQKPAKWMDHHRLMESFRGREIGVEYAEAYIRASLGPSSKNLSGLMENMQAIKEMERAG